MEWKAETVTLQCPVRDGETLIRSATVREPNAGELVEIEEIGIGFDEQEMTLKQVLGLIEILSDLPPAAVKKLHRRDVAALAEALGPLMEISADEYATPQSAAKASARSTKAASAKPARHSVKH